MRNTTDSVRACAFALAALAIALRHSPVVAAEVLTLDETVYGAFEGADADEGEPLLRVAGRSLALSRVVALEFGPLVDRLDGPVVLATTGGDLLPGEVTEGDVDSVTLRSGLLGTVRLPLDHLRAVFYTANLPSGCEGARSRRDLLASHEADDAVLLATGTRLPGTLKRVDASGLRFSAEALGDVNLEPAKVQGAVLAIIEEPPALASPHVVLHLSDGGRLAGNLVGATKDALRLRPRFSGSLDLPLAQVAALHVVGGRSVFLSDLEPEEVVPTPYFGDELAEWDEFYKADASWEGCPLTIQGRVFAKGVGVHTRTELVYALDGRYERFVATVGLDDRARRRPEVRPSARFLVEVDGERRFDSGLVGRDDPPREIGVAVRGGRRLRLVADFGDNADILGHADWAMARLTRAE
ncbi:MAG: NPCBM/NEW2 domain-containing protein [Planctomycetes bacterium]|nr:NPCBM/NEW2 domain-containing protein [Planctomycetota bacterium]